MTTGSRRGNALGTIEADVQAFIRETRHLLGGNVQHSFDIRLYKCLPTMTIFRVDDELFWGPYLVREPSRNSPIFIFRRHGLLFHHLLDHFEHIWNDTTLSRSIPEEWLRRV